MALSNSHHEICVHFRTRSRNLPVSTDVLRAGNPRAPKNPAFHSKFQFPDWLSLVGTIRLSKRRLVGISTLISERQKEATMT